jgi:cytochrome c5
MKKVMTFMFITILLSTILCCGNSQQTGDNNSPGEDTTINEVEVSLDGKSLLEDRCTICHSLDKVYPKAYDAEEWEEVIDRMIKKGAKLNDDEIEILLDHLILE